MDDVWTAIFKQEGQTYRPPAAVVLYDQATGTGCGMGQSAMGPFYCPQDQKVYLDLAFWQELETKFGAQGEAARAYVIAHEIGHHVQNLTRRRPTRPGGWARAGAESGSVRLELQADCYAGVWVAHAPEVSGGQVQLDPKDVEDGLRAAAAVGDDTLQRQSTGRVAPDSFTHGIVRAAHALVPHRRQHRRSRRLRHLPGGAALAPCSGGATGSRCAAQGGRGT